MLGVTVTIFLKEQDLDRLRTTGVNEADLIYGQLFFSSATALPTSPLTSLDVLVLLIASYCTLLKNVSKANS